MNGIWIGKRKLSCDRRDYEDVLLQFVLPNEENMSTRRGNQLRHVHKNWLSETKKLRTAWYRIHGPLHVSMACYNVSMDRYMYPWTITCIHGPLHVTMDRYI